MKTYGFYYFLPLFSFFLFISVLVQGIDPKEMISINFGAMGSNSTDAGSIYASTHWNTMFKGNSAYLIDEYGAQTSCYVRTNSATSSQNYFNYGNYSISENYIGTGYSPLNITLFSVPFETYDLIIYIEDAGIKGNNLRLTLNGSEYNAKVIKNDYAARYALIQNLDLDKLSLLLENNIGISALQIVKNNDLQTFITEKAKESTGNFVYPTVIEKEVMNLDLSDFPMGDYSLEIIDNSGKIIAGNFIHKNPDTQTYQWNIGKIPFGCYMVIIYGDNTKRNQQIIKD
jgi:hypothetical protein